MVDYQPPPPTLWILVLAFCYILEPLVVHASTNVPPTALGVCVQPRMPVITDMQRTVRRQVWVWFSSIPSGGAVVPPHWDIVVLQIVLSLGCCWVEHL